MGKIMPYKDAQEWEQIKAAAMALLFAGPEKEPRETVQKFIDGMEAKISDAYAAERQIDDIIAKLRVVPIQPPKGFYERFSSAFGTAVQSPPFYFFFGLFMLVAALICTEMRFNSSLTFLAAMLGVAILLYGTGSQAAGSFGLNPPAVARTPSEKVDTSTTDQVAATTVAQGVTPLVSAPWNVAIAGGAAVLSAFFGWSVINYAPQIRQVFRDDDQYTVIKVNFCDSSVSACLDNKDENRSRTVAEVTSLIPQEAMRTILNGAYLETSFGHRAFTRQNGATLEFVVFDRDLDDGNEVRLVAGAAIDADRSFSVNSNFFSPQTKRRCVIDQAGLATEDDADISKCEAGIYRLTNATKDQQRVRWLVLRALVKQDPSKRLVQNLSVDDPTPTNPVSPL